ncbi:MAG: hypothetical protein KJ044_03520 [Planctomycetes bacterium]|nr:hypothetical protein [Planctomycetota bacterium]
MPQVSASGINLSAFGATRRPLLALARQSADGVVELTLRPAPGFDTRARLGESPQTLFAAWAQALLDAPKPLAVDVALAFEPPAETGHLWRFTHRDADFAFFGDAPLTDRVGEFGLRFRAWLARSAWRPGVEIFEASPRGTIELMEFKGQYKDGSAHHGKGQWKPDDKTRRGDKLMAHMLTELGVNPAPGAERFSSDDFDAMICALTALAVAGNAPLARGRELAAEVSARCERRADLPAGSVHATVPESLAVLARPFWESVTVSRG